MLQLDHIAIAAETLEEGRAYVEMALGVPLLEGGRHDRYGTHNSLLGLDDGLYLEVITLDPFAAPTGRTPWFGLDEFKGPPRCANWICRTDNLAKTLLQMPPETGPAVSLTRGTLAWQITVPDDGSLPRDGAVPTLLEWGQGITPPGDTLPQSGCRLTGWEIHHPRALETAAWINIDDPRIRFYKSDTPSFVAHFDTPNGPVTLE